MADIGERLYQVSWGFAILWLGISIIVGYLGGYNIFGFYLSGIGLYGLIASVYGFNSTGDKTYLVFTTGSIIALFIGLSIASGGLVDYVILLGISLVVIGIMVIVYYIM